MLGLRLNLFGPFWLEDLLYAALDGTSRLPEHARALSRHAGRLIASARETARATLARPAAAPAPEPPAAVASRPEAELLDEQLSWLLATEPLTQSCARAAAAVAFQKKAAEQLDASAYTLSRLREDLRPIMKYSAMPGDSPLPLRAASEFETSLEALLALSRANAATRPKDRLTYAA